MATPSGSRSEADAEILPAKPISIADHVAIRFAGDSGDGMQITGTKFTEASALAGNDLSTFPDFPAEIRAPAGTLAGVSAYQIHFSAEAVYTPADEVDLLVAFNPAALRANIEDLRDGGMVLVNSDAFTRKAWARAGYDKDPLEALRASSTVYEVPLTSLNRSACQGLSLGQRDIDRSKNFFALGLLYWLYSRPIESTKRWLSNRFKDDVLEANLRALRAGHAFGETAELFPVHFAVPAAKIEPGTYRNITGNTALAWGIVAAREVFDRPVFLGAYPITPASDVLHEVARHRNFNVKTFQAEDEISAISSAIGAAFAGHLAITISSGPGIVLKQEALGLAVMVELPLVVVDVQRAGPSTGSPTKTEQGDLMLAIHGRHSESPLPVIAANGPGDCFNAVIEAFQMAVRYMTPVILLSDSYLANSSEPWRIPAVDSLPQQTVHYAEPGAGEFEPYRRDPETGARPWAIPGTPGLEHRIGGLTKAPVTGNVVYDPENHAAMVEARAKKVADIANDLPPLEINGPPNGRLLLVSWGGTLGSVTAAIQEVREAGREISTLHLRQMNPLPRDLGEKLKAFDHVLVPELNDGQLCSLLRAKYLVDAESFSKVNGQPFKVSELKARIEACLDGGKR
ncbi:MAG: 2-oxoacid:acceptor oxidoreductase subunit alpha [Myxococcota bacterium]